MATKVIKDKINFKGKMFSVGFDMHKYSGRISAVVQWDIVLAASLADPIVILLK